MLGKQLTRRSRGRCELCEGQVDVRPYELPPFPEEPDPERTLMTCGRCRDWLERGEVDPIQAHFLSSAVWAELPPVRLAAARLLLACDDLSDPWLQDALDAANVDPETGEFAAAPEA
jgi:protein PhnA